MKIVFSFLLMLSCVSSYAQRGERNRDGDIDSKIAAKTTRLSEEILRNSSHLSLNGRAKNELLQALSDALDVVQDEGSSRPRRVQYNKVVAYSDDRCTNQITQVLGTDSCTSLGSIFGNTSVWSIAVNDTCVDISDQYFRSACNSLQAISAERLSPGARNIEIYSDDRCTNKMAAITPEFTCNAWTPILNGRSVWSLKVDETCINISDTSFSSNVCNGYVQAAAEMNRGPSEGEPVEFFTDDACRVRMTSVARGDNCSALNAFFNGLSVWSVQFRGACVNISDTSFINACSNYTR